MVTEIYRLFPGKIFYLVYILEKAQIFLLIVRSGNGPNGENWKLEEMIGEMMKGVSEILEPENSFLVLNTYSLGFSSLIIQNLLEEHFPKRKDTATGEIYLRATSGVVLPLGVVGRIG